LLYIYITMDKPSKKAEAVLKLLNTLGRKTLNEDFGIDLTFEYVDEVNDRNYFRFDVRTEPPIEEVTYVENRPWGPERFIRPMSIIMSLENLAHYLGFNQNNFGIKITNVNIINDRVFDTVDITEKEDDFYIIESLGTVLHIPTGQTFPYSEDNMVDYDEGEYLEYIQNQEWWDSISSKDKQSLINFYKK
jgi:hypothetical protein